MKYRIDKNRNKSKARHEQKRRELAKDKFKRRRTLTQQAVSSFKKRFEEQESGAFRDVHQKSVKIKFRKDE